MIVIANKWNEDKILMELNNITKELGHFPSNKDIRNIGRDDLRGAIYKGTNRGINYYRTLLDINILRHTVGYWTEDKIIKELKYIIDIVGYMPSSLEIRKIKGGLSCAISKNGGYNRYRLILEEVCMKKPNHYWNDYNITKELKNIIEKIGHFPLTEELFIINKTLCSAISANGGINKYRKNLCYKEAKRSKGHWSEDEILSSLELLCNKLKRFPTFNEIEQEYKGCILRYIMDRGGINKYRRLLGYEDVPFGLIGKYISKRGRNTENIVYTLIEDYCKRKNLQLPIRNFKFKSKKIIEFVCNVNGTIGIDVTNTRTIRCISQKWLKRDYHTYLDMLIIVVFSNILTENDYKLLTNKAPKNVFVIGIDEFCNILQSELDDVMKNKIETYKQCTFMDRIIKNK